MIVPTIIAQFRDIVAKLELGPDLPLRDRATALRDISHLAFEAACALSMAATGAALQDAQRVCRMAMDAVADTVPAPKPHDRSTAMEENRDGS
jgi:hypothetical protein